jgi:hypothetical protein
MAQVNLKETLQLINSGDWVALRFITADVLKGTGGKVMEFAKCRIAPNRQPNSKKQDNVKTTGDLKRKDHNHHLHFTLNMELPNHMLRKVHPILITHINNQQIL